MKIIYIDSDEETRDHVSLILEGGYDCLLYEFSNLADARNKILELKEKLSMVISDTDYPEELLELLSSMKSEISVMWIGGDSDKEFFVARPVEEDDLCSVFEKASGLRPYRDYSDDTRALLVNNTLFKKKEEEVEEDTGDYKKIELSKFYQFKSVNTDIFIRVGKLKFVKVFEKDNDYPHERLDTYKAKNVNYLFVHKDDHEKFQQQFSDKAVDLLDTVNDQNLGTDIRAVAELVCIGNIQDHLTGFGLNEDMKNKVNTFINSNVKTLGKIPEMSSLLERIMKGKDYFAEHSLMISYVAGQIASATTWRSDSALEKLSMAAMLHDYGLMDSEFVRQHDKAEDLTGLEVPTIKLIKAHPQKGSDYITSGEQLFTEVELIIAQHHEVPWIGSYPKKLAPIKVNPLACIFMIAEKYVSSIYGKKKEHVDIDAIKREIAEKFNKGNFKMALAAFLKVF